MKILHVFLLFGIFKNGVGLKCWTCSRALTNEECIKKGSVKTCRPSEACINRETTSHGESRYEISKGCQRNNMDVCLNRDRKNPGNYRTICRQLQRTTVCSCCCNTDLCNGPQVECKKMITCRRPDAPGNGRILCQHPISYGSSCSITCKVGFRRVGAQRITCISDINQGYWSPRQSTACVAVSSRQQQQQPQRKARQCDEKMAAPAHGSMVCENQARYEEKSSYDFMGTICAFKCEPGYFLDGTETTQCLAGGRWNVNAPTCRKGTCQRPPQDGRRVDSCSDGNYFGSICDVRCKAGFMLIGSSSISCLTLNDVVRQGTWSSEFPRCVIAVCRPELTRPGNGEMSCTKRNLLGSVCTFSCKRGFQIINADATVNGVVKCVRNGNSVEWKGLPPQCRRLKCPRMQTPENGNVVCTGNGYIGTKCIFRCNKGYDMVRNSELSLLSKCIHGKAALGAFKAIMSVESIDCVQVHCQSKRTDPANGRVICSRGNLQGSVCTFTCNHGYGMDGTTNKTVTNICEYDSSGDGRGKWSAPAATCNTRLHCADIQGDPINGAMTCTDRSFIGSVCDFKCNEGYQIKGTTRISCRDLAQDGAVEIKWTNVPPVCIASTCPELWYDKTKMRATCTTEKEGSGYPIGTKCDYECSDYRYYMETPNEINRDIICLSKHRWSVPQAPRCFVKTCTRLSKLEHGNAPICSDGNLVSSVCTFKCNSKYSLSHNQPVTCDSGGRNDKRGEWDIPPPTCVLSECRELPPTPRRGVVSCSNDARLGSSCTLKCDKGYFPKASEVHCQKMVASGKTQIPAFVNEEDFCCAECRSEFFITLAVDARFERGLQNVGDFAKMFLSQLSQRNNQIIFSAFAYSTDVNQSTIIDRSDIKETGNAQAILEKIKEWKVGKERVASNARSALEYANEASFSRLNSNHANFLIVASDNPPDNVDRELIKRMRRRGINIIIGTRSDFVRIRWRKLLDTEGDVKNLNSNEIIAGMDTVAFSNGCSKLASECV